MTSCQLLTNDVVAAVHHLLAVRTQPGNDELLLALVSCLRDLFQVPWCDVVWCGGVVWCGVVWCGVGWCGVVGCGVV